MRAKSVLLIFVLLWSFTGFTSNTGSEPGQWRKTLDLDFENTVLDCWFVGGEYKIEPDNTDVYHGRQSLRFTSIKGTKAALPGFAAARLPVPRFRGKRIRLSGALKTSNATAPFTLWLRADAGEDPAAYNELYRKSPKGTTNWKQYSVELDVPIVTTALYFGAVIYGEGSAWVDDLSIEVLPPLGSNPLAIGGIVQYKNKTFVPNALIAAKTLYHETAMACASSDKNGEFEFHLPAGTYMLTVTAPGLTAGILPSRDFKKDAQDLVLTLGEGRGFTIKGKVKAPPGKITTDSYVVVNQLVSVNSTIFYVPLNPDGSFQVTVPTGEAYRIDLDSPLLKVVPVMIEKVTTAGEKYRCLLEAIVPQPAPDQVVSWIKQNAVSIRSPEPGQGFSDLLPLKKIVGSARVVAMGEATHGTREIFQMKHRFLEFLVEEMGFTVFAMEGMAAQALAINDYVLHGNGDLEKVMARYAPVWSTGEIITMIQWMRTYNADPFHKKKVKFYGLEVGDTRDAVAYLEKYLEKVDPVTVKNFEKILSLFKKADAYEIVMKYSDKEYKALQEILKRFLSHFDGEKTAYTARSSPLEWEKARQYVRHLQQDAEYSFIPGDNDYCFLDLRARFMAENTRWILDTEPPGTKIMLWAHNFHISLSQYPGYPFILMGMHLRRLLGNDYLAIGFVFNRGCFQGLDFTSPNREHIALKSFTVGPYPGSYGMAMSRTGLPFFFLDLHRVPASGVVHDWFSVPRVCKWVDLIYDNEKDIKYLLQLPRLFDAVIFIDKTTRARPLPQGRQPNFPY
ncbi:MAG: erythromycin esterase family protein [Candidatus Aminicenantes bacterium]|jgi:erythromycin esterase